MNSLDKISGLLKTFPTIMHITQEIKIMHLLEELSETEIINGINTFIEILNDLDLSHGDNYVMEYDTKTINEYNVFIKWLEKIKIVKELKSYSIYIDDIIDTMGTYYSKKEYTIEKIFTEEEIKYICISGIFKRKYNGKEYYIIIYLENNEVIAVDKNKMVYKIKHNPNEIELINNKLIDYLKEIE